MGKKRSSFKKLLIFLAMAVVLSTAALTIYLDVTVRERFEGKRFALPARVYARALEIYPGKVLRTPDLLAELAMLGYRETERVGEPGTYGIQNDAVTLVTRPFRFGDGVQEEAKLQLVIEDGRVSSLVDHSGRSVELVRLDPVLIGGIYPGNNEDRVLVKLDDVPRHVVDALIAVEDRRFYSHHGIDPRGILRAVIATASGKGIQGGSTLTQQLVKNFYLTSERTLQRKFTEMIMAILLEAHYSKEEILETYINEVYLGQDGNRAIHGFGLAGSHYFDKPLERLSLAETALLVGMLKGPAQFSPRNHPQRALDRRNLVLAQMRDAGVITSDQLIAARTSPLGVVQRPPRGTSPFPGFLGLVHRQLQRDYRDEDLRSEGLQIFTTLDPMVQRSAENALARRLARFETEQGMAASTLQGGVVVASTQGAEVLAVVPGRNARMDGYNRALDARRPIGSLIKPFIFLTALQRAQQYTLATLLDDSPLVLEQAGTTDWAPQNYDKTFHGNVPLQTALAQSYNAASARLGLDIGVPAVMDTLHRFGLEREVPGFASSLLGANEFSPLEMTQLYQTIAGGGFRTPLRAIREVLTADGVPLQRYPLNVEQAVDGPALHLLSVAMQEVVRTGTAKGLSSYLDPSYGVAGKTGTTDEFRDSWFAGFTGDRLAVVWVGRDDNKPTGLTGSSGAMTVWGELMAGLDPEPLVLPVPETVEYIWIDPLTGLRSAERCPGAVKLPFITGSAPVESAPCGPSQIGGSIKGWFKRLFK
ncbi:MAG: penicillin-binding protein 1B [Desulfovibrionales bacterium]